MMGVGSVLRRAKAIATCVAVFLLICGMVFGQRDETMYQVQKKLVELGYSPGSPDGVSGPRTVRAIKAFQTDNKLPATGSLDDATLKKLLGSAKANVSPSTSSWFALSQPRRIAA